MFRLLSLGLALVFLAACDAADPSFDLGDVEDRGDVPGNDPAPPQYGDQFVRATVGGAPWQARNLLNPEGLGLILGLEGFDLVRADVPDEPITFVYGTGLPYDFAVPGARLVQTGGYLLAVDEVVVIEGEPRATGRTEALFVTTLVDAEGTPIADPNLEVPMVSYAVCVYAADGREDCEAEAGPFSATGAATSISFTTLTDSTIAGTFTATLTSESDPSETLTITDGAFSVDLLSLETLSGPAPWAARGPAWPSVGR